jgi:ribosomal protein S10
MKQFSFKIRSKNEKSLNFFLSFIFNHLKIKFNIFQKVSETFKNRKIITFLTSPHVNKTAQEHFEAHVFLKQIDIKSFCCHQNIVFLKKIIDKLFHDISICLKLLINTYKKNTCTLFVFYTDKFKVFVQKSLQRNFKRNKHKFKLKKYNYKSYFLFNLSKFLNTISVFGEIKIRLN